MKQLTAVFLSLIIVVQLLAPSASLAQTPDQISLSQMASLISSLQSILNSLKAKVASLKGSSSISTAQAQTSNITISETAILPTPDNGNGNLLVAQSTTLSQTATIQSLSFYVTTAAGSLRLGIYDATGPGGGPGAKQAETNSFTPVVGWNTANVITPVSLTSGTYWLTYLPSSSSLGFRLDYSGSARYYSYTYGALPTTFSTSPTSGTYHWSFYATLSTGGTPPPTDTQAPTAPANLNATPVSSSQINLSWTQSTDNIGVMGYRIERCQGSSCTTFTQISTPSSNSYNDTGLAANTTYRYQVRAVDAAGNFSNYSSIASATTQSVSSTTQYGLDWPGTGTVRRMLYWSNPPVAYNMTYLFKVYQRNQVTGVGDGSRYYTTFFHGNNGTFTWGSDYYRSFYGAHPYPTPAPTGDGKWEISTNANDYVTRDDGTSPYVTSNRWYSQAFLAQDTGGTNRNHRFYIDLPSVSTANTITQLTFSGYAVPPSPAIVLGQSPDNGSGQSWGGYSRWEEQNAIIRGVQIYSSALTESQILALAALDTDAEINAKVAELGITSLWYLNMNPRPSDVTDKKDTGTPHNPQWAGTTALEWSSQAAPPDTQAPTAPTNLSATAISSSQINLTWNASTDNVGVTQYRVERCQGSSCTNFAQIATPTGTSYNDTGLTANTTYRYQVRATDAAGNLSAYSGIGSGVTQAETSTKFSLNDRVYVSSGPLNVRETPSLSGTILGTQVTNAEGTIVGGPIAADGFNWWNIDYDIAPDGWSAEDFLEKVAPPPLAGLVAGYAFSEGTGTSAADSSGNNYHGSLVNNPTWTTGVYGSALQFSATNDGNDSNDPRVAIGTNLDVPSLPFTVSVWVNPVNYSDYGAIFSKRDSYSASNMRFDIGLGAGGGNVYVTSVTSFIQFSYTPPTNIWTHLALVADSTGTKLYVNGNLQQTLGVLMLGTDALANVVLGGTGEPVSGGDNDPFHGSLDNLRVYNRALSASEIQTDMNTPL